MIDLSLQLTVSPAIAIRHQSVYVTFNLTNNSPQTVEVPSLTTRNNVLSVVLTGAGREPRTADQHAFPESVGNHIHERNVATIKLGPGKSTARTEDIASWFGEIEPGEYQLQGTYSGDPEKEASSEPVSFKVIEAAPQVITPFRIAARVATAPRETTWVNEGSGGGRLFLLRLNDRNPTVIERCFPLADTTGPIAAKVSSGLEHPPGFRYIAYVKPDQRLQVLTLGPDDQPSEARQEPIPTAGLGIIGSAYCDAGRGLAVVLATPTGSHASLMRLSGGKFSSRSWEPAPAISQTHAVCWNADESVHIAWADPSNQIYVQSMALDSDSTGMPRRLVQSAHRVEHIRVDEVVGDGGVRAAILTVLSHDDVTDYYHRARYRISDGSEVLHESTRVPGSGFWRAFDSAMTDDGALAYLASDAHGNVFLLPPDLAKSAPLKAQYTQALTRAMSPTLVSGGGREPDAPFVLVFVREGKQIERRALPME